MTQFAFANNQLQLKVKPAPLAVRLLLVLVTLLCFALPLFGIFLNILEGNAIKFGNLLTLGLFSLLGFRLLRASLWNTYGEEIITFSENQIEYIANYRWFKDGKKTIENTAVAYSIKPIGYEEEKLGVLVITNAASEIESVVKMPTHALELVISKLQTAR